MINKLWLRIVIFSLISPAISYISVLVFWPLGFLVRPIFQPLWSYDTDRYGDTTFHATHQGWVWAGGYSLFVGAVAAVITRHKTFKKGFASIFGVAIISGIITHLIMHIIAPTFHTTMP